MTLRFDGHVALVTGAGKGLGRTYCEWLAARGARIVVNSRLHEGQPSPAEQVAEIIRSAGGEAIADHNSITSQEGGAAMVQAALRQFGRLDIIIANAGGTSKKPVLETTVADIAENMDSNFWGSVHPVLAALPYFIETNYGRIVLTTSAAGLFGQKQYTAYAAAKMAIVGFGRALAVETGKLGIRVNMISPYARTPGSAHVLGERMAKIMSPDLVAAAVGWLAHESCTQTGLIYSIGAGRIRRAAMVEGPVLPYSEEDLPELAQKLGSLAGFTESRNSGRSSLELIPELGQQSD
jgi:NAD(P)-dependent dehydrogenase (short-subunit alcohol dehydrogenase family)